MDFVFETRRLRFYSSATPGLSFPTQLFVIACSFVEAGSSIDDQSILSELLQVCLADRRDGILTAVLTDR